MFGVCDYTHCNASVVHFFVIWITVLLLVLWRITRRFFDVSGISTVENSFSTMAEITPTMSLVVEIPETSENLTCYAP